MWTKKLKIQQFRFSVLTCSYLLAAPGYWAGVYINYVGINAGTLSNHKE